MGFREELLPPQVASTSLAAVASELLRDRRRQGPLWKKNDERARSLSLHGARVDD